MPRGKILSEEEKGKIRAYKDDGHTNRWIGRKIGRSHDVINRFLRNPAEYGRAKGRGRKPKLTKRMKRRILRDVSNSTKGTRQIQREFAPNCSHMTVWKAIKESPNLVRQRLRRQPKLTEQHKAARLAFAEERA